AGAHRAPEGRTVPAGGRRSGLGAGGMSVAVMPRPLVVPIRGSGVMLRVLILTRAQRTVQKTRGPCTVSHGLVLAPFRGGPVPRSTARIPPNSPHHRFAETRSPKPRHESAPRNSLSGVRGVP